MTHSLVGTAEVGESSDGYVAGGVVAALRSVLMEREQWDYVRESFAARCGLHDDWLDHVSRSQWVELGSFVALLDAAGDMLGTDELRSLVRRRIMDASGSNFFAPMLRSWARSFGGSPEHMLRGVAQVWRAAHRNVGNVRASALSDDEVHLLVEGRAADVCRASPAAAAFFEGLALAFLDLAQPRPVFVEVELVTRREPLALICRFGEFTSRRLPVIGPAPTR